MPAPPRIGIADLVATASAGITRLTRVSHRSPARLLPLRPALANAAGAATCALGSYGGGLLGGDQIHLNVHTGEDATLTVTTQASSKVYRKKSADGHPASQNLRGTVGDGGLFVYAPDPIVPFAQSAYVGDQRFDLHPNASLIAVDWVGSGRAMCGERWSFDSYSSRTEVYFNEGLQGEPPNNKAKPSLVEAVSLQPSSANEQPSEGFDLGGTARDAAVSIVLYGPRVQEAVSRFHAASATLAHRRATTGAGVRDARDGVPSVLHDAAQSAAAADGAANTESEPHHGSTTSVHGGSSLDGLFGEALLGVSDVRVNDARGTGKAASGELTFTVARLVAECNEDVYRVLHHCLLPLGPSVGIAPYSDRIHSSRTAPLTLLQHHKTGGRHGAHRKERWRRQAVSMPARVEEAAAAPGVPLGPPSLQPSPLPAESAAVANAMDGGGGGGGLAAPGVSSDQMLRLLHVCDATLPTGGFAHSGGLEAAMQLGLLKRDGGVQAALRTLGISAIRSAAQQQTPFAIAAHTAVTKALPALKADDDEAVASLGKELRDVCAAQHALLAANAPGCRASLQLGSALTRITTSWMVSPAQGTGGGGENAATSRAARALEQQRKGGVTVHGAPALGVLAALLELPPSAVLSAFVYTSARDLLSAAVRLNLIGPIAAVSVQHDVVREVAAGNEALLGKSCDQAAGSAPLVEAVHACHDLLERRIFQT